MSETACGSTEEQNRFVSAHPEDLDGIAAGAELLAAMENEIGVFRPCAKDGSFKEAAGAPGRFRTVFQLLVRPLHHPDAHAPPRG